MNLVVLHREDDREGFFAERRAEGLFHDPTIDAWVAATPQDCEAVLRSRDFEVSPYGDHYDALAARGEAFQFPNMAFAFHHLPMCLWAEDHASARQRTAAHIAAMRPRLTVAVPAMVDRHVALLDAEGPVDAMKDVLRPLTLDFIAVLAGIDTSEPALGVISPVFDRMISLRRRRIIDDGIASIRDAVRRAAGAITPEEEGVRLTLVIVGVDSLAGTLGESLHAILSGNAGKRLDEIDYPAAPVATGVPFVERVARIDTTVAGVALKQGERVRVMLQAFQYSGRERDRLALFGAGAHLCLGRQISLDLWAALCARLARIRRRAAVTSRTYRVSDYVFAHPDVLTLEMGA